MYVDREIKRKFDKLCNTYKVLVVVGARQAGKTTFLKEKIKNIKSSYLLFDDPDVRGIFEEDIKKFEKQYITEHDTTVLDEVQYCKDAGIKLKYLAEKGHKLWITSSSEIILGKNVLAYLVGRVAILRMYPFSLNEYLVAKNQKESTAAILKRSVWEHILYGGYPQIVLENDFETKKIMLKNLYDTMILKDIANTFSIENTRSLEEFTRYLSYNIGNVLSYESLSKAMSLSFQTVKKYLDAMEKSYLIIQVHPFFTNKLKEIIKQPKVYFIDTGLRNIIAKSFSAEPDGKLFENYVLSELIKSDLTPKYWRTKSKAEVDFVIEKDNEIMPIEIKLSAEIGKIGKSMRAFIDAYNPKRAFVVSYNGINDEMKVNGCKIIFIGIHKIKERLFNE